MGRTAKKSPPKDPGGHKWKGPLPKGWTDASRSKFWSSLTSKAPKHKVTECIKRMTGKVGNPGAFCAALADRSIPGWRAEAAKERRKKKAELAFTREERHEYGRCALEWSEAEGTTDPLEKVATAMRLAGCAVKFHQPDEIRKSAAIFRAVTAPGLSQTQPLRTRRDYGEVPEEDEDEPPHSQIPGSDNLTMEEDHRVASEWITRTEMEKLCPPCAERMRKAGLKKVRSSVVRRMIQASRVSR